MEVIRGDAHVTLLMLTGPHRLPGIRSSAGPRAGRPGGARSALARWCGVHCQRSTGRWRRSANRVTPSDVVQATGGYCCWSLGHRRPPGCRAWAVGRGLLHTFQFTLCLLCRKLNVDRLSLWDSPSGFEIARCLSCQYKCQTASQAQRLAPSPTVCSGSRYMSRVYARNTSLARACDGRPAAVGSFPVTTALMTAVVASESSHIVLVSPSTPLGHRGDTPGLSRHVVSPG